MTKITTIDTRLHANHHIPPFVEGTQYVKEFWYNFTGQITTFTGSRTMEKSSNDADQKLIEKIQKLLALANSDNENEARSASAKAQALLTKHNLSTQDLKLKLTYLEEDTGPQGFKYPAHMDGIIDILQNFFFVKCKIRRIRDTNRDPFLKSRFMVHIVLVGTPTNVAVANHVFLFLCNTYKNLWQKIKKTKSYVNRAIQESFYFGVSLGIAETLKESKKAVEKEMGLVIIPDPGLDALFETVKEYKPKEKEFYGDIASRGYQEGLKVRINPVLNEKKEQNEVLQLA